MVTDPLKTTPETSPVKTPKKRTPRDKDAPKRKYVRKKRPVEDADTTSSGSRRSSTDTDVDRSPEKSKRIRFEDMDFSTAPWMVDENWIVAIEPPIEQIVERKTFEDLLHQTQKRIQQISKWFDESSKEEKTGEITNIEKQVDILLGSFKDMISAEDEIGFLENRQEYLICYLPNALNNLSHFSSQRIMHWFSYNRKLPILDDFLLFECLALHSKFAPVALNLAGGLVRFFNEFRFWLHELINKQ